MRRTAPSALVAAALAAVPVTAQDPLAELLASGDLERANHAVAAEFYFAEGAARLSESERAAALEQISASLARQTSGFGLMMEGFLGMMSGDTARQMQEYAERASKPGGVAKSMFGFGPAPPPIDPRGLQEEMKQAMVDPWVRGIAAAEALVAAGETDDAALFYRSCLQFLQVDWIPDACLEGILGLGPRKAYEVLDWLHENAESTSFSALAAAFGQPEPPRPKNQLPDPGVVQIRAAALAGLGALIGSGALEPAERERAMRALLARAEGKANEAYAAGVATGLGRSRDPRAVAPLHKLAKRRGDPEAKQAALHGLAVGFRDEAAIRQLRGELDDRDPEEQLRAAQALYELGDAAALDWAVEVIGRRRTTDSKKADVRAQVVRDLVELGGEPGRRALERALAEGPGNDWLAAWVEVGLLELGDLARLERVEAAIGRTDWELDPRGFRSVWRSIRPFLQAAVTTALTGGLGLASPSTLQMVQQATQTIANFAAGERTRSLAEKSRLEAAIAQIRWQSADAIGAANPDRGAAILQRLLADQDAAVRLSAALALARLDRPEALDGIAAAFTLAYGEEGGIDRSGAVRAALLRAALLRFPGAPGTRELLEAARRDADGGVRFIALVGARSAI